jgi:hypothetical protein
MRSQSAEGRFTPGLQASHASVLEFVVETPCGAAESAIMHGVLRLRRAIRFAIGSAALRMTRVRGHGELGRGSFTVRRGTLS